MPTTDGIWRSEAGRDTAHHWPVGLVLVASVLFFVAVALFLTARRLAGALVEPLPTGPLLATAALMLAWTWGVRAIGGRVLADSSARWLTNWPPFVAMLLVAVACSYPGNRWLDWAVWLPALCGAWLLRDPRILKTDRFFKVTSSPRDPGLGMSNERGSTEILSDERRGQLLQQLTRIRMAEGREAIHGVLLAEFAEGQQIATLYIGFCPPFEQLPHVEAEVADGPPANVKLVQVLHHGVQLNVVLACPAAEATLASVEFMAAEGTEVPGAGSQG